MFSNKNLNNKPKWLNCKWFESLQNSGKVNFLIIGDIDNEFNLHLCTVLILRILFGENFYLELF